MKKTGRVVEKIVATPTAMSVAIAKVFGLTRRATIVKRTMIKGGEPLAHTFIRRR